MKKHLTVITTLLAVLSSTVLLLSLFIATSAFAQDTPHSEEYMEQHDGGDRSEYLQELKVDEPPFYVPPTNASMMNDTILSAEQ